MLLCRRRVELSLTLTCGPMVERCLTTLPRSSIFWRLSWPTFRSLHRACHPPGLELRIPESFLSDQKIPAAVIPLSWKTSLKRPWTWTDDYMLGGHPRLSLGSRYLSLQLMTYIQPYELLVYMTRFATSIHPSRPPASTTLGAVPVYLYFKSLTNADRHCRQDQSLRWSSMNIMPPRGSNHSLMASAQAYPIFSGTTCARTNPTRSPVLNFLSFPLALMAPPRNHR